MKATRSRTSAGPSKFIGGAAMSTKATPPSRRTRRVSKLITDAPHETGKESGAHPGGGLVRAARSALAGLAERAEASAHFGNEEIWLLPRGEVGAAIEAPVVEELRIRGAGP